MTFKELRGAVKHGPRIVRWNRSGIVEVASLMPNGAVKITNVATQCGYILPRHPEYDLSLFSQPYVRLGDLLPKRPR